MRRGANYNYYIKKLFGNKYGIDKHLSFSLQFSSIQEEHATKLREFDDLPKNIASYINAFDSEMPDEEFNDMRYSYRVLYVPKSVNRKGQADKVIEFIPASSPEAKKLNAEYILIKEKEKPKYLPSKIVQIMQDEGYPNFGIYQHTQLWKQMDAKKEGKGLGVQVAKTWYWYDSWLKEVRKHCQENAAEYQ